MWRDPYFLSLQEEDQAREQQYLESIGAFGQLFDNDLYFCVILVCIVNASFWIGFGIAQLL